MNVGFISLNTNTLYILYYWWRRLVIVTEVSYHYHHPKNCLLLLKLSDTRVYNLSVTDFNYHLIIIIIILDRLLTV